MTKPVVSLSVKVAQTNDGRWVARAPWLKKPVFGKSFEEVYEKALKERPKK